MVQVIEGKIIIMENDLKGNENRFEFELLRVQVTEGKITVNV